jgi:putative hydrolase of the HAD superfamily
MARRFDAVSLDVGGVLVVPDHGVLGDALAVAGIAHDRSRFGVGHYLAMAALDRALSAAEDFSDYLPAFVAAVAVPDADRARAVSVLERALRPPVFCQPVPGSRQGLAALRDAGLRLAVTSNSDGTVADQLRRHEWLQVGEGPGVPVVAISDSGLLGVAKPDPRAFEATATALAVAPERVLHVGDSVHYDVDGAAAAGMQAVHMDPFGLCSHAGHAHVRSLGEVLGLA